MNPKKKRSLIPVAGSQLTATVSVAMVLFILGVMALTAVATRRVTQSIKEQVGFVVVLTPGVTPGQINDLKKRFGSSEEIASYRFASADEVMTRWKNDMGADLDLDETLLGVNPFYPEFEVNFRAAYSHPDTIASRAAIVEQLDGVDKVEMNLDTAREVSRSLDNVILIMLLLAAALMAISFVLINNTIRLSIYARRFQIHTMKLVGATAGFIRRPFVGRSAVSGLIAAAMASAALAAAYFYMARIEPYLANVLTVMDLSLAIAGTFVAGAALSSLAALFATNRYIRISYDDMFK